MDLSNHPPENSLTNRVEKENIPQWKAWLKKNFLLLVGGIVLLVVFMGLLWAKNVYLPQSGQATLFTNPEAPDLAEQNQNQQKVQGKVNRLAEINRMIGQEETSTNPQKAISSSASYTSFHGSEVYQQKTELKPVTPTNPVSNQELVKPINKPLGVAPKHKKEAVITENPTNGFNTVVLATTPHDKSIIQPSSQTTYLKAAVYGSQTIRSGSAVRIRLLESAVIDGIEVPANSICTGIALLSGNRVSIALTAVQIRGQQYPIKKIVCDKDLIPGITFVNENALEQSIRQQRQATIDQTSNALLNNIPTGAGTAIATGTNIVRGISQSIRHGGIQKQAGEIQLEEGYKVFIMQ